MAAVLVIGFVLVFIALRESERERLAFEKNWGIAQESAADFISERVRYVLTETESRIQQQIINLLQSSSLSSFQQILKDFVDKEVLVSHLFLIKENDQIVFPFFKPPYLAQQDPEFKLDMTLSSPLLLEAEEFEFKKNNYSAAIKAYQSLLRNAKSNNLKANFLNGIARCFNKAGNFDQATSTYLMLRKDYDQEASEGGLPLGFVARYSLGKLYFERENTAAGIEQYFEIYSSLCEGKWTLTENQFALYSLKIEERIPEEIEKLSDLIQAEDMREKWKNLLLLKTDQLGRLELLEVLERFFVPAAMEDISSSSANLEDFFYFSESVNKASYNAGFFTLPNNEVLGFLLDAPALARETLLSAALFPNTIKGMKIDIADEQGNILAVFPNVPNESQRESLPVYSQAFSDLLPAWKVTIYPYNQEDREKALTSRRNIYLSLALFVTAALFFGGFMGIRNLVKQMEIVRMKSEFVATVSHELRTPLTSIRYMIDLLKHGRVQKEEKKQKFYLTLSHESERLSRLIENILDFSKIEGGMKEYQFEWTDAVSLTESVAESAQELAKQKGFDLKTEIQNPIPKVWMDGEAVSRALFNLLDNAFKYSETSKNIIFRASLKNQEISWEIQDFGIGIPDEEKIRIFEKFYRYPHTNDKDVKGSGIGLTIVKHIVEAHKGQINMDSKPGKGTTFTLGFPSGTNTDQ